MDQRIESFLADVLALAGEEPDAVREGVRVALASARRSSGCGSLTIGEHLKLAAERHGPAGALSCPSAALRLLEIDKGAVHASLAMATAPIVLV
jgi:hypothetical protein